MQSSHRTSLKPLTDHYIQVDILARLAKGGTTIRFTDLKDPGIENSHFMYHANKLLDRGLIQKVEPKGFELTAKGAEWINFVGLQDMHPQMTPRLLIQLVIRNSKNEILFSRRKGKLGELLNEYMLPGGLYKYGVSAPDNALSILAKFGIDANQSNLEFITIAETLAINPSGNQYHSLAWIYSLNLVVADDLQGEELYDVIWASEDQVLTSKEFEQAEFLREFLKRFSEGKISANETFAL